MILSPCGDTNSYGVLLESFRHIEWGQLSKHQLQPPSPDLQSPQQQKSDPQERTWIPGHPCRTSWCRHFQKNMAAARKSSWSIHLQEDSGTLDTSKWSWRFPGNRWSVDTRRCLCNRRLGKQRTIGRIFWLWISHKLYKETVDHYLLISWKYLTWISFKSNLADTVMAAIGVDAISVLSTAFSTFWTLVQVSTPW